MNMKKLLASLIILSTLLAVALFAASSLQTAIDQLNVILEDQLVPVFHFTELVLDTFLVTLLVNSFLVIFIAYTLVRVAWKAWDIAKLRRRGGLLTRRIIKGRAAVGLLMGIISVVFSISAFFLPWYTMNATFQYGTPVQQGTTTIMSIKGIDGLQINLSIIDALSGSSSVINNIIPIQLPLAIVIASGIILLILDIIGVKNKNSLSNAMFFGTIGVLLPIVAIIVIIVLLPSIIPGLIPGQAIPDQVMSLLNTVAANPIVGSTNIIFPIIGTITFAWSFGLGAYMFIIAAILRIIGGIIIRTAPNPKNEQTHISSSSATNESK